MFSTAEPVLCGENRLQRNRLRRRFNSEDETEQVLFLEGEVSDILYLSHFTPDRNPSRGPYIGDVWPCNGLPEITGRRNPTYPITAVQAAEGNQSCACFVSLCVVVALQAVHVTLKTN